MSVVRINTVDLTFDKSRKTLVGSADALGIGFPSTIEVKSHITDRVIKFVTNSEKMLENEFFDGEECHYVATDSKVNAQYLVLLAH